MMYKVKCKKCGQNMQYQPLTKVTSTTIKKCVFCNFSIKVKEYITSEPKQTKDLPSFL